MLFMWPFKKKPKIPVSIASIHEKEWNELREAAKELSHEASLAKLMMDSYSLGGGGASGGIGALDVLNEGISSEAWHPGEKWNPMVFSEGRAYNLGELLRLIAGDAAKALEHTRKAERALDKFLILRKKIEKRI